MLDNLILGVAYDFLMENNETYTGELLAKTDTYATIRQEGGVILTLNAADIILVK